MQDCYIGDIGDFGKYGLLKALCPENADKFGPFLSLGVVWYLFPNEKNADGRHIDYLKVKEGSLEPCDHILFYKLKKITLIDRDRRVRRIKEDDVLPSCRSFYEEKVKLNNACVSNAASRDQKKNSRERWLKGAYDAVKECEVVFLDPDNGLEVKSASMFSKKGPKYTFLSDLNQYWKNNKSLVIYQHLSRGSKKKEQLKYRAKQIKEHFVNEGLKPYSSAFALYYKRISPRFFIVLPSTSHKDALLYRAEHFVEGSWGQHFDIFPI